MDTDISIIRELHKMCAANYAEFKRKYGDIKFNFAQKMYFDKNRFEPLTKK